MRKASEPAKSPSAYRLICLLDVGKNLEKIIANRIVRYLSRNDPDLSISQYGFREGRSTIDAIKHVRFLSEFETRKDSVGDIV